MTRDEHPTGAEHLTSAEHLIAASSLGADGMVELCARTPDDLAAAIRSRLHHPHLTHRGPAAARTTTALRELLNTAATPLHRLLRTAWTYRERRFLRQLQRRAEWIDAARHATDTQHPTSNAEHWTNHRPR